MEFLGYDSDEEENKDVIVINNHNTGSILSKWTTAASSDSDDNLDDENENNDIITEKKETVTDLLNSLTSKPDFLKKNKHEEFQVEYVKNHVYDKIDEETKQKKFYNYRKSKEKEKEKPINKGYFIEYCLIVYVISKELKEIEEELDDTIKVMPSIKEMRSKNPITRDRPKDRDRSGSRSRERDPKKSKKPSDKESAKRSEEEMKQRQQFDS